MKKSTLSTVALVIATLALLIVSISTCAQDLHYGYRETYQNNVRTRSIDTVKISIDEAQKRVVITEQVAGRVSVNCFTIVQQTLDNSIATQWTLRIQSASSIQDTPLSYLFLDKTNGRTLTYSCDYTIYVFDNDSTKVLGSKKLKVAHKRKKTSPDHYSFLNL